MAGAMTYLVVDKGIVIYMLFLVGYHTATEVTLSPLALQFKVHLIASQPIMQGNDIMVETAIGFLLNIKITHAHILVMRLFQTIQVERGILAHIRLNNLGGQELAVIGGMVTEKQLHLCPRLDNDQHPAVDHQVHIRPQNIDYLDGTVHLDIPRNVHEQAILRQHRIESRYGIGIRMGDFRIIIADKFGILSGIVA